MVNDTAPEPLDLPPGYGVTEVGTDHWRLDEIYERIHEARSWWITSVRPDQRPHIKPVWGVAIDRSIVFSCGHDTVTIANVASNPHITLNLESGDEVIIVEGTCTSLPGSQAPDGFMAAYVEQYEFEFDVNDPKFPLWKVTPTKVMAWDESDFVDTAVRYRF